MLEIVIDGKKEIGRTSPFLFGQNLEHLQNIIYGGIFDENSKLSDKRGFRLDVLEALRKIKPGILRWPGGCFASSYHWENGVGPRSERPIVYDYAWRAEENNGFGTNEFIEYCHAVGAEPYITVNATSGTPEEAARWVEYCNLAGNTHYAQSRKNNGYLKPHNVKYWSIDNEKWGDSSYAKKCRETARLMKKVDPNIKLTAVGEYLGSPSGTDWNLEVLKTAGDYIDFLSVHRYYYDRKEVGEKDYYNLLACPTFSERKLITVAELIDATKSFLRKEKDIKISMDEWNFRTNPLCSALATCRFFNTLQRLSNYVTIAGFFPAFIATDLTVIITGQLIEALEDTILLESSYYAFDLYANHSGEIVLETIVESERYDAELRLPDRDVHVREVPYVDSSATLSADRRTLFISTVNAHKDNNMAAKIQLNLSAKKVVRVFELNGPDVMAVNDADNPTRVSITEKTFENRRESFTYEFPPHSTTILELQVE